MHVSCLEMNENEQDDIGHIYCPCNVFIKKHSFSAVKKVVMWQKYISTQYIKWKIGTCMNEKKMYKWKSASNKSQRISGNVNRLNKMIIKHAMKTHYDCDKQKPD